MSAKSERARKVQRYTCWWCQKVLKPRNLHHEALASPRPRPCCKACHEDASGFYRLVYPGGEEQECKELGQQLLRQIRGEK